MPPSTTIWGGRYWQARSGGNEKAAQLAEEGWRRRWQAGRRFLQADGESGKRYGSETIRVTPDGEVSIKLPSPLAHLFWSTAFAPRPGSTYSLPLSL
ncbi:hypothetical protein [Streptomyces sp. NPDC002172]